MAVGDPLRRPLDVATLHADFIATDSPWRELTVVEKTGSTNADLLARAAAGKDVAGAVLIAEHQTAGRGRIGRVWSAVPHAQVLMSVGIGATDVNPDAWGWLPLATGVAVVDAVAAVCRIEAGLKWPNDVLVGDRKLAGILAEVAVPRSTIVVGVGLNVSLRADEVGEPAATSLLELGVKADRNALVRRLLLELRARIDDWRTADPRLADDYRARSLTLGSDVRVELPGQRSLVGKAESIDPQGRLTINSDGDVVTVSAGDVVHLRPAR
ncbi:birA, biotin-(acetyl-CoA-carboxylase) ligase [Mycobacterium sp. JS623]|uniref:biotin--[acetyl-CoA-carboxylase] ligase n=1 Tax=Mycobacterium sp. JS623 TaxID=212767 RepID=UPI0002A5804C|nr:biotin--[acetyl-CoA-carboxylase] ligase [Mycobacterium sp. JS623]AGB21752.1 birA, biotin-(acetyl-CoA-carboxylase) ligase [Mycobacterium sp. JS623]